MFFIETKNKYQQATVTELASLHTHEGIWSSIMRDFDSLKNNRLVLYMHADLINIGIVNLNAGMIY